jgi:hypothetical protein
MAHMRDEVLALVQVEYPDAYDVSEVHPGSDREWWVVAGDQSTFAFAWFDETDAFNVRPYKP